MYYNINFEFYLETKGDKFLNNKEYEEGHVFLSLSPKAFEAVEHILVNVFKFRKVGYNNTKSIFYVTRHDR